MAVVAVSILDIEFLITSSYHGKELSVHHTETIVTRTKKVLFQELTSHNGFRVRAYEVHDLRNKLDLLRRKQTRAYRDGIQERTHR